MFKFKFLTIPYLLPTICYLLFLSGCRTTPIVSSPATSGVPGIYHRVQKKETLWRISQMYNVELDDLAKINHITDASNIETGQLIFVPRRQKQLYVATTQNSFEDFSWPVRGKIVTSFGQVSGSMLNKGLNIKSYGASDVLASRAGRVVFCTNNFAGFGKTVIIDHGDGFLTVYSRSTDIFVKPGDKVSKGAVIARVGNNDLHFEIRKGSIAQNPAFFLGGQS